MQTIIFDQTPEWLVETHGNGVGYRLVHRPSGRDAWLQGNDAIVWEDYYHAMLRAHLTAGTAMHQRDWDWCLADLCRDYVYVE